jgi:RNA polymerase sigma-70 factor (ECF subfamily)
VLARLVRTVHDLDLAEDALARALEAALVQWPVSGVPPTPRAWLVRTARNKAIDELRRRASWEVKQQEASWLAALDADARAEDDMPIRDDMLRLLFTCCHPALPEAARVALTLQVVVGLQADEIARAFLVPTVTMAQRLVRAKRKIKDAGVPYRVPGPDEIGPRAAGVRAVVYLVFNEGYAATRGDAWVRHDLCRHAIRLGESLHELFPGDVETAGLLALMLLHEARHAAREDAAGDLVLLADQDRSRWDRVQIDRGAALVEGALRSGLPGPYALQAAIAAVHALAPSGDATDWPQLVGLYDRLVVLVPTAVVALNRAVAIAFARTPADGLAEVERLGDALVDYPLFHSARADLLRRCGQHDAAVVAYRRALELTHNAPERRFLEQRLRELASGTS